MQPPRDVPAVIIFPPVIPISILVLGLVLQFSIPLNLLVQISFSARLFVGAVFFVAGAATVVAANRIFHRLETPARPTKPALALATTGVFAWTRNPMYLGGGFALAGLAIGFALDWVILLLIASLPLLHYGIILPEEAYLESKFGDEYRRYKERVARYFRLF